MNRMQFTGRWVVGNARSSGSRREMDRQAAREHGAEPGAVARRAARLARSLWLELE